MENPGDEQLRQIAFAVEAAIADLDRGDRGIPADEHVKQVRAKYNLPADR